MQSNIQQDNLIIYSVLIKNIKHVNEYFKFR